MTGGRSLRPRVDYESRAVALDRNELGALLAAAGPGPPAGHALMALLALNGLRVPEATGADIEHLGLDRGHRTLVITRQDGKVVTVPLAPRTARAIGSPREREPSFCAEIRRSGGWSPSCISGLYVWLPGPWHRPARPGLDPQLPRHGCP